MNNSYADLERRVHYVSKNHGKRSAAARIRSMHRLVKDAAEADTLTGAERASIVALIVSHWPEGEQVPDLVTLAAQCRNLRAAHIRWKELRDEAAKSLADHNAPPSTASPAYAAATGRSRKGTNYSIYLRDEVHAWLITQCPLEQRGKAELVRGINALYEKCRDCLWAAPASTQVCPDNPSELCQDEGCPQAGSEHICVADSLPAEPLAAQAFDPLND